MTTIIVGAGASGLACAVRLKQNNPDCEVIVLERLSQPGRKILATGNGRCNLSNERAEHCDEVIDFFSSIGLVTRSDSEGRIYPYSNQASTVLEILLKQCQKQGVEIITDCRVESIGTDLCVTTDRGIFFADNVVIATGGKAQKALGSDGSGYGILKSLGHSVTELCPALVQLTSPSKHPRALKGQRVKCRMSVLFDREPASSQYGEVLFTDYGLSGIVTMNLSESVSRNFNSPSPKKCIAELDLVPDMTLEQLDKYVKQFASLEGILGERLSKIIEKQVDGDTDKLAKYAKHWRLIINGTKGYDFAQITSGGVNTEELDNFKSKLVNGIYVCGEIIDRQFECGGFNLNFAWYSGICTANSITKNEQD